MKFTVTFKDPDVVHDAIERAIKASLEPQEGLDDEEVEAIVEQRMEEIEDSIKKWVKYSEYVTIQFDTDAGTAAVLPNRD